MSDALASHDALIEDAIVANGGVVFSTGGDGFGAAFQAVSSAVSAAVRAQRALAAETWPAGCALRVRMGIHTGEAVERADNYFGPPVNLCARLMSVAHGAQLVCTGTVAALLDDSVELLDLGEHRFRDVESVVRVSQVVIPGLTNEFPPLRSLGAYRTNIGYELSSFVGRDDDLKLLLDAIEQSRAVSIVGSGGVGKTRTAIRLGTRALPRFPDGVWLCELAPVAADDGVAAAALSALGVTAGPGVAISDALVQSIEPKQMLLILDNCEHVIDGAAQLVAEICRRAPNVTVVSTSRQALGIKGERVFPLRTLGVPSGDTVDAVLETEAGALFAARASEVQSDFAVTEQNAGDIALLCRRLDGVPLAVELAASRMAALSVHDIVSRLDRRFELLDAGSRGGPGRHETLQAAIDWSYDLLSPDERHALQRCSVFAGGFDVAALAAVADLDEIDAMQLVASLVEKSLAERTTDIGTSRYRLLETVRHYSAARLDADGESDAVREAHARYYINFAARQIERLLTPEDFEAFERLELELANISTAADWLVGRGRVRELMPVIENVTGAWLYPLSFNAAQVFGRLATTAIRDPDAFTPEGFVRAVSTAATAAFSAGDSALIDEIVELADAHARARDAGHLARAMRCSMQADMAGMATEAGEALAARPDFDPFSRSGVLVLLAMGEAPMEPDKGRGDAEEAVALARTVGADTALLLPLFNLALVLAFSDQEAALVAAEECIRLDRTPRRIWGTNAAAVAAQIHAGSGDLPTALTEWRRVIAHFDATGDRVQAGQQIALLANAIADSNATIALELGLIVESGSIASTQIFDSAYAPSLSRVVHETDPAIIADSRKSIATWSYRASMDTVLATIDQLIAQV
jgi:predicted ATPase